MKVLVVGGGAREHALCWALAASPDCSTLWCAPGNAGIAEIAELQPIAAEDVEGLVAFCQEHRPDLVVIGPEAPLVAGLANRLTDLGLRVFGPSAEAAILEGSKGFMKDLCAKYNIPTARYGRFKDPVEAIAFARQLGGPVVVKADGLAAGKGVIICLNAEEAEAAIDATLRKGRFGTAGEEVVVEEFLEGEEVSFFALCDGRSALPMASAQDHKRVFDGDHGPNTGGMGAYSPAPIMTEDLGRRVMREIIEPTVAGMAAEGRPFRGVLFAGLMIEPDGTPKLLEHNVRFGDPECQVLMLRLETDLLKVLLAACEERLSDITLKWSPDAAIAVVMAAEGYPGAYESGTEIQKLEAAATVEGATLFHVGTRRAADGRLLAVGGRVLSVCATGSDLAQAQARAYEAVDRIDWPEGFCRRDIGWRALGRT